MTTPRLIGTAIFTLIFSYATAWADVTLPSFISDHMVLQKTATVPIWGTAAPSEHIAVTVNGVKGEADAGADGKWRVTLDLHDQAAGPFDMTVQGKNLITVHDVLIGEVWLCGGQSNMELTVSRTIDAKADVAASANPQIRLFQCKSKFSTTPLDTIDGTWTIAGPTTTAAYTAVGYYFAKKVNQELGVPVGLISCNFGGSAAEAWMSPDALAQDPDLKASSDKMLAAETGYPPLLKDYQAKYAAWQAQYHREDKPAADPKTFAAPGVSTSDWKTADLDKPLSESGLPDAGVIWLRKTMNVTPAQVGMHLIMHLGEIHDFDTVYWNGEVIGSTTAEKSTSSNDGDDPSLNRRYDVPAPMLKAGPATLAIRIFAPAGGAGISGKMSIPGQGSWLAKAEYELPPLDAAAKAAYPQQPLVPGAQRNTAAMLYNGMLYPLIPYAMRGVLWYQGETNVGRAVQYRTTFPMLIKNWRAVWGEGDFPFYFCQLANFLPKRNTPGESAWAELRDAQTSTLSVPNTGQAVLIDLGEVADIHYRDKKDAGVRMALIALANTYGKPIPFSGPMYDSMTVEGKTIRLHFQHTDQGLVAKTLPATYALKSTMKADQPLIKNSPNSELQGFTICGQDHKWVWADAKIDGSTVVVSSAQVPAPVAVRYAWADNPTCNLYNGAGLPTCPFRTDDFPLTTENAKY